MKDLNRLTKHHRACCRAVQKKWRTAEAFATYYSKTEVDMARFNALIRCAPTCSQSVFVRALQACII